MGPAGAGRSADPEPRRVFHGHGGQLVRVDDFARPPPAQQEGHVPDAQGVLEKCAMGHGVRG